MTGQLAENKEEPFAKGNLGQRGEASLKIPNKGITCMEVIKSQRLSQSQKQTRCTQVSTREATDHECRLGSAHGKGGSRQG